MASQINKAVAISPATFKWIFKTVVILTMVSLAISVGLSFFSNPLLKSQRNA